LGPSYDYYLKLWLVSIEKVSIFPEWIFSLPPIEL